MGFAVAASRSGSRPSSGVPPQLPPLARRQLQHEPGRMCRNPLDDVPQVDERIDLEALAGLHQ